MSFCSVGPRNGTQVSRLGYRPLYPLSHPTGPQCTLISVVSLPCLLACGIFARAFPLLGSLTLCGESTVDLSLWVASGMFLVGAVINGTAHNICVCISWRAGAHRWAECSSRSGNAGPDGGYLSQ